ncbi:S9 family peptidase [Hyphobacterium marinum]|uniref:S9 family peptidase n=1 Tax=Hyphobacterium marinum TaxID=3116574 RepID=A0ABU7M0P1_9PROT|nr:S9 family peptidase [Hyphobacterium sp. Y6023]MEE2567369.1 S9 family peptidase [Hyphobacterium sp. Y6023]
MSKFAVFGAIVALTAACSQENDMDDQTVAAPAETEAAPDSLIARAQTLNAPVAERRPVEIEQVGRTRVDNYGWLRDDNWQEVMRDPSVLRQDIRDHLEAENAYYEAVMEPTAALQERLYQEMRGRILEDDSTVPEADGPYAYYTRFREGGQYPIYARRQVNPETGEPEGDEEILLDGDAEAGDFEYLDFGNVDHSPDHRYLAFGVDTRGSEYYEVRIKDVASGAIIATLTDESTGNFAWSNDSQTLFWVWRDDNGRSKRVYRQSIDSAEADLIYDEADDGFFVNVGRSDGDSFIVISTSGHTTSELRLIDANNPTSDPVLVAERETDVEYDLIEAGDRLYFRTNADGAVDFKIVEAPMDAPGRENWVDVVPHRAGTLINTAIGFRDWMVRLERENALPRIVVRNLESGEEHDIAFDEEAYSLGIDGGYEFAVDRLRFSYESPSTPEETYDYDMATRERTLLKRQEIPSGHNVEDYVVRRIMAPSHDGEMIPVTLLYHRDTPVDGSAPLMLYGYGSYGITIPASFRVTPLSLVDRGMIYAIAHIRGSMARGYGWYLDGKLENKINTFRDFVSAGEALIDQGYTSRGNMVAYGGSAGGLLVGAAINMAPDLFAGAIGAVPFVDVINTMSDAELPLTPPEWPEWGNPLESATDYDTMMEYSPYDNVTAQDYPHVLATAGLTDPRVTYWEPAKWVAVLRHERTDDGLTLMRTNMGAGHGGASGRFDSLRETAQNWAFALMTVGLADAEVAALAAETSAEAEGGE